MDFSRSWWLIGVAGGNIFSRKIFLKNITYKNIFFRRTSWLFSVSAEKILHFLKIWKIFQNCLKNLILRPLGFLGYSADFARSWWLIGVAGGKYYFTKKIPQKYYLQEYIFSKLFKKMFSPTSLLFRVFCWLYTLLVANRGCWGKYLKNIFHKKLSTLLLGKIYFHIWNISERYFFKIVL